MNRSFLSSQTAALSAALVILCFGAALYGLWILPPGQPIAVHFDMDGHPNGWMPAWPGLMAGPALAAFCWILCALRPGVPGMTALAACLPAVGAQIVILGKALGRDWNVGHIVAIALGLSCLLIGNGLGKLRPNSRAGIRTPQTLADNEIWGATQRFAGWAVVTAGMVILMAAASPLSTRLRLIVLITAPLLASLVSAQWSRVLWRRKYPGEAAPVLPGAGWFGTKTVGVGISPRTWQGWLVTALFLVGFAFVRLPMARFGLIVAFGAIIAFTYERDTRR